MALRTTSLLGLSAEELKKRYDFLMTHEFSSILSLRLALEVPTLLSFDSPSSSRIIKLFKKYELGLYTFLVEPSVFSLDPDIVERNIMTLFDIGLSSSQISFLFCKYSACVALPMNQEALESVRKLSSTCNEESGSFINGIVKSSLGAITVKNDQGLEFEGAISFLNEVKVPINIILGKYPEFFSYSSQHLWHCFDCLTNGPLFFDEEALKEYIENNPDIFVTVDQKPIQDLISKLRQLISDGNRLFALFIRKSKLFTKPSIVLQKISILEKWKFSDEQITKLLFQFHSLFSAERDNLNDRLKFLLGSGDLTTQGLVTLGICLTIRSSVMKWRIGFLREKNIEALSLFEGGDLMFSDEETFAVNICKSTFAEFDAYVKKHSHFEKYNYYLEKREVRNAQVIEKAKLDK